MAAAKAVSRPAVTSKPKTVAEYIAWQIQLSGKSQTEIASEVGFDKPNVITMIKQGKTKVPLNKIGKMAKALEVDPVHFFRMCINEYVPDLEDTIKSITGGPIVSKNEMEFIKVIRSSKVQNPKLSSDSEKKRLKEFVDSLKGDNQ